MQGTKIRQDVHGRIAAQIVADLEKGALG